MGLWDPKLLHVKLPIHVPTTRRIDDEGVAGCNGLTDRHFENPNLRLNRPERDSHFVHELNSLNSDHEARWLDLPESWHLLRQIESAG